MKSKKKIYLFGSSSRPLDPDAKAYLDLIGCPSPTVRAKWSQSVIDMKNSGVWAISDRILPFPVWSGMSESSAWTVCAKTLASMSPTGPVLNNGSNYYLTDVGQYMDLVYTPNSSIMTATDYLMAFRWSFSVFPTDQAFSICGCSNSTSRVLGWNFGNSKVIGDYFGPVGKTSAIDAYYDQFGADFRIGQRTSATSLEHYQGTSLIASNTTNDTGTLPSFSMIIGAFNTSGTPQQAFSEGGIGYFHLGKSWNSAQRAQMTATEAAWSAVNGR